MTTRISTAMRVVLLALIAWDALAQQQPPRVELFTPTGTVKRVRQVRARFSEAMVPFGDPRAAESPFVVDCAEKGTGRWVDSRNWVFDFERDLAAGVRCEFRVRDGLRALGGIDIAGTRSFAFSTGGPAVTRSVPSDGAQGIDEGQIFILELDGAATEGSILANVRFGVEGIASRIGARIVAGSERDAILKTRYEFREGPPRPLVLVAARQTFPAGAKVALVWGRGVAAPSGVATEADQRLSFVTRTPFAATLSCERENPDAACVPITPVRLSFSAPVAAASAHKAVVVGPGGRRWMQKISAAQRSESFVQEVLFEGPFPERAAFQLELPPGVEDDAGRVLANADKFPLAFRTDAYPPLAKFAAEFGILELKSSPMLPVTLRNVEPAVSARSLQVAGGEGSVDPPRPLREGENVAGEMKGTVFQVPPDKASQMLDWIKRVHSRTWEARDKSIFGSVTGPKARSFKVPRLRGPKPFEVVGIPLPKPGFYVVEIESEILGAALLGAPKPMFVPTTVLVTNLSVHFKRGLDSSLVWVTTLDRARPVAAATVVVRDCSGKTLWEGRTDASGVARPERLPPSGSTAECGSENLEHGLLVTAQLGEDLAFVHTSWNDGIEPWRFHLPTEYERDLVLAHTVFDRTLLRAGDTVHMKHLLRRHATAGFAFVPEPERPSGLTIQHLGSEAKYELPLRWDAAGAAESTWTIPKEAKLGAYQVLLTRGGESSPVYGSGEFRVEEFRVPLMRGVIQPPAGALIAPQAVPVDVSVSYLSGGGAGNLPAKLRWTTQPRGSVSFAELEDFTFGAGKVKEGLVRPESDEARPRAEELKSADLTLDRSGAARTTISGLPPLEQPADLVAELEFRDPNGSTQTISARIPLWPAARLVGIRPDSWTLARDLLKFQVAVTDLAGTPVSGAPVRVDSLERKTYSHRKRLVGGFYAFEHSTEIKKVGTVCEGMTDRRGLVVCEKASPISGNVILQAVTRDDAGREAATHGDVWVAGKDEWWFAAEDGDRIDLVPEKRRYEPGQPARFQVRMPFRKATALVTVEREGVGEVFVSELSGTEPVLEVPMKGNYAPNAFVSVLIVRGRVGGVQPTATVDLGRPSYKLGIAEVQVGWRAHELKVKVSPERAVYKVREKARVSIAVTTADGKPAPRGCEVALAAVDEGLLELQPNGSWQVLEAMMGRRRYAVETSTAQMHVIGRRHFGLKALPQGGGGGKQATRELFDTLLLWKGRVPLDDRGEATVEVPLNDSLTSFRIVAIATSGPGNFGSGGASIRTTQDLMILSGIAPLVRNGDRYRSVFTVRNTTERRLDVEVAAQVAGAGELRPSSVSLAAGEAREVAWELTAPPSAESLRYEVKARARDGVSDSLSVVQRVVPAVPVRTVAATLTQLDAETRVPVERPRDALPGRGGVEVAFRPTLVSGLTGVTEFMKTYPYSCLEQEVSRAISLRDAARWGRLMALVPGYLDADGLAKYFPSSTLGSEVLTAYVISIAHESGWELPAGAREKMLQGLRGFAQGRIVRHGVLPTADLSLRKLAAIAALARTESEGIPALLASITIDPNLWPTSALLDWLTILERVPAVRNRTERLREVDQIMRSRLTFQGTLLGLSTERSDYLWWLMVSTDSNAARLLAARVEAPEWRGDVPRLVRGVLARQRRGHWDTTVANTWGVLALEKFSRVFEATPVAGTSSAALGSTQSVDWNAAPKGKVLEFPWPAEASSIVLRTSGAGRPWAAVASLAAIPLKEPLSSGFKIRRTVTPVEQKTRGVWSRGDIIRVRLELEAQSDMTWVAVTDPIPAGASILGTGLGRDSQLLTRGEERRGWVWPAFEERSFEAFRAYYEYVPKGAWTVEYTVRLNNEGMFQLPPSRVEALYTPEMFGEAPNETVRVQ